MRLRARERERERERETNLRGRKMKDVTVERPKNEEMKGRDVREGTRREKEGEEESRVYHITYGALWSFFFSFSNTSKILFNNFNSFIIIFLKVIKGNIQSVSYENFFKFLVANILFWIGILFLTWYYIKCLIKYG